jgi:hypothetical protein
MGKSWKSLGHQSLDGANSLFDMFKMLYMRLKLQKLFIVALWPWQFAVTVRKPVETLPNVGSSAEHHGRTSLLCRYSGQTVLPDVGLLKLDTTYY